MQCFPRLSISSLSSHLGWFCPPDQGRPRGRPWNNNLCHRDQKCKRFIHFPFQHWNKFFVGLNSTVPRVYKRETVKKNSKKINWLWKEIPRNLKPLFLCTIYTFPWFSYRDSFKSIMFVYQRSQYLITVFISEIHQS